MRPQQAYILVEERVILRKAASAPKLATRLKLTLFLYTPPEGFSGTNPTSDSVAKAQQRRKAGLNEAAGNH